MREHRELILNYFRAQKLLSSGGVEGLNNNKAKVTTRKSYGFRAFRCPELALYSLGKLPEQKSPRFVLTSQRFQYLMAANFGRLRSSSTKSGSSTLGPLG